MRATGLVAHLALANFATANVAARADDEVWRPLADALAAYPAIHARELGKLSRGDPSARVVFAVTRKGPRPRAAIERRLRRVRALRSSFGRDPEKSRAANQKRRILAGRD
mmetsp:Transcript_33039/g.102406  ORF Transcript_33039/g.102406 Transcript_33039/m.102406 type:complete len:110 (+) Transcript_33039:196-525(+)